MERQWNDWAPLPLRIVFGIGFMVHGYPKLFIPEARQGTAGFFANLGIPLPEISVWIVGIVEFFGGLLLVLGAFVTVVSALCLIDMVVAILLAHLPAVFDASNEPSGIELPLLYAAAFAALIISGAGKLSVDQAIHRDREREPASTETGAGVYEDRPRST